MVDDKKLQRYVLDELEWEPSVNSAHIGVATKRGVVTLTGHVGSYVEKRAAERAASRVKGVKAIAQEIEVRLASEPKQADDEIAARAVRMLEWDVSVPNDRIWVTVENGRVTLTGEVDWHYQKNAAELDVQKLGGVLGVTNRITIKPQVHPTAVRDKIEQAFRRTAELDAAGITITADGGKVTLGGKVHTWYERQMAERAVWSAPGVTQVEDHIAVA
jgi:osmotically-inducible protein OsmY